MGQTPDIGRVEALTEVSVPSDVPQLWSLLSGLSYYRKFPSEPSETSPGPNQSTQTKGFPLFHGWHDEHGKEPPARVERTPPCPCVS